MPVSQHYQQAFSQPADRTAHAVSDDTAIAAAMDQRLTNMRQHYLATCQRLADDPCRPGLVTAADVALRGLQELWLDGEGRG